nr:MATE family efflux transporter [uncultured Hyphomonas sp.]
MPESESHARRHHGADLTHGPILPALVLFAVPTLISSVLQSLNGSINAIWIGRFLGEAGLTATSNSNLVMFLLLGTVFGFGMSATILVGQSIGRGNVDDARRAVGVTAFWFALVSILVAILGYIFTPEMLSLMDTPAAAASLATSYLRVIFLAIPGMFFLNFLMMALRGSGDSVTPMIFMGIAALLDVGLNPVLILGLGPAPRLGIAGSATATLIAQYTGLGLMLTYIYWKNLSIRLRGAEWKYVRPAKALSASILVKGLPMGLQMLVVSGSAILMISFVNRYGITTSAAYGVSAQLWNYIQMPAMALGAATSAMAAQNIGAGNWKRVDAITRSGIIANVAMTGALVGLVYFADRAALSLFLGNQTATIDIAQHINAVVSWGFVMFGVMMVIFGTVRATGAVIPPLIIVTLSLVGVRVGITAFLEPTLGQEAIWWSYPISSAVSMVLAIGYYRFGKWREATMLAGPQPARPSQPEAEHASSPSKPSWIGVD